LLRQRSRPYLFSNSLAPPIVCASLKAIDLVDTQPQLRRQLWDNTRFFRAGLEALGLDVRPGETPILPVMLGEARLAAEMAELLLARGIYVIGFSFPVVPKGQARIRTQVSAAHSREDLVQALDGFAEAKAELGL
ncbi:MAG: aminotransferase class I/II-fold pyridoxal phosphate-dependent enzyme, partial [Phycisphaerae bacterium]|nr:aminotransferase class I/II-fold pyridoxal phosphate-dependent enzyme [Phycisphaerae bacterium]